MARFSEQHELLKGARARTRRRTVIRIFLGWAVLLVVLGGGIYAFLAADALKVQEIRVEGVRLADHGKVKTALAETLRAGTLRSWLEPDLVLFWLFVKPPERFLAAFPMFRAVKVAPSFFARTVTVRVAEREPYGVWCRVPISGQSGTSDREASGTGSACYVFDYEGIVFGEAPATYGTLIIKVNDVRTGPFSMGEAVLSDAEWRARILRTLDILKGLRLTPRAIVVWEQALREWEVTLGEGPTLKFSFMFVPERLEEALAALSRRADFRALTYLDFRVHDRLFYK